jgi:chloramphenicol 3-O phosphotransferase
VPGRVIFLHGASSSGKSTLARALQKRIEMPFLHYSIDHLRDSGVLPLARVKAGDFAWAAMRAPFFSGFHRSVAGFVTAGNNVILEHIIDTEGWLGELAGLLAGCDVFMVGVHCPLDELQRREAARGDRPRGSAEADYNSIHKGMRYDCELSSLDDVEDNVERLLAAWRMRSPPGAFAAMAEAAERAAELQDGRLAR